MESNSPNNALEGFLSLHDLETPEKVKEVAREELGETEDLKQKCLHEMKALITGVWNPSICTDEELATIGIVLLSYATEKESAQVTGAYTIIDSTHISLIHLPMVLRQGYWVHNFLFNSLPVRYKEFHIINEHPFLKYVLTALDPFLPNKVKSRIVLHGQTRDAFFQVFPRSIIPEEYGGTLGPLNNDHLIDPILDYLQKMKEEQQYYLRPEDIGLKTILPNSVSSCARYR